MEILFAFSFFLSGENRNKKTTGIIVRISRIGYDPSDVKFIGFPFFSIPFFISPDCYIFLYLCSSLNKVPFFPVSSLSLVCPGGKKKKSKATSDSHGTPFAPANDKPRFHSPQRLLKYDDEEEHFKRHEICQSSPDRSPLNTTMDLVVTAGDKAFPVSRDSLAESSGYFGQLLSQLPTEQRQLSVPDLVPSEYLSLLLASTASEECLGAALTQANVYQILLYAQLLQMPRAAAQCRAFLASLQQQMLQNQNHSVQQRAKQH